MIKEDKAITLLELLITSTIFIIVMIVIYSAFHTGIFGYSDIEKNIDIYQSAGQVLERINLDVRNSFVFSSQDSKFQGANDKISFLCIVDSFRQDAILQDFAFVSYELQEDKLMRLCRENKDALDEGSETQPEEMLSNVEGLGFSYGYIEEGSKDLRFKDVWEDKKELPKAIKIKLTLGNKIKQEFERTIFYP